MQRGYLIGESPSGEIKLIESGDPREMRRMFKQADGKGLVSLEVIESTTGRTRRKRFPKNLAATIDHDINALREIASGDKRKAETRDAIAQLAELEK